MIDLFNPQVSKVVGGLDGKLLLVYGSNRTGKTLNATKAEKPFVVAFERGLNAIDGIPFQPISKWQDWIEVVKQLTGPRMDELKQLYKTIIVDTIDSMGDMAQETIANRFGVRSIGEGRNGYGLWKEYSAEVEKWLRFLTNAGYTVVFIGHETFQEKQSADGVKYIQAYPFGDRRVVKPIVDMCDIIGYAHSVPMGEDGQEILSTLYLRLNPAFFAGSRFAHIDPYIKEWNMEKLEATITKAIAETEKATGHKAVTFAQMQETLAAATKSKWADLSFEEVQDLALTKASKLMDQCGGDPTQYQELLFRELSTKDFSLTNAIPQQRDIVEQILNALVEVVG